MAKLLKLRRGTTSQHSSFTGAEGEVTVDTDKETLVVHNGSTAGGFPVARADGTGVANFTITGELDAATGDFSGDVDVDGTLEADAITVNGTALSTVITGTTVTNAAGLTGTPDVTVGVVTAGSLDISGNADIDGTLEADAYTVNGTALDTHIAGVTVTNSTNAAHVSVADNENTNENNKIPFIEDASATGNVGLESDGDFHYNPSSGQLTVPAVSTSGNVTVAGNLTVNGTTTTVATTNTTVTDNLLELNSGASSNANDSGILIERGSTGDNAIIAWDESADKFTVGTTTATNDATGNISITTGTIVANVEGNVTGNTSGSSGSCTGNAATATQLATARTIGGTSFNGTANITPAEATNADTVDSLHASSFIRSDAADTASGDITFSGGAGAVSIGANSDIRQASGTWTGESPGKIQHHSNILYLQGGTSGIQFRADDGAANGTWNINSTGRLYPSDNEGSDLGGSSNYVQNAYIKDVYVSNWIRSNDADHGLYNVANNNYWYSDDANYWTLAYNGSNGGIRFRDGHGGAIKGYIYANDSSEIGFLDNGGNWSFKCASNRDAYFYGHAYAYANNVLDVGSSSYRFRNGYFGTKVYDGKGDLRAIPSSAKSSAYTLVAGVAGEAVYISTGGVTVPNSVMSAGDAVTIINNSGSDQTITQGSGVTMYNSADASTGNRTLAARGMATLWFASASVCYISGAGLS